MNKERRAEILRGNIEVYENRINNYQRSIDAMREELPSMKKELAELSTQEDVPKFSFQGMYLSIEEACRVLADYVTSVDDPNILRYVADCVGIVQNELMNKDPSKKALNDLRCPGCGDFMCLGGCAHK